MPNLAEPAALIGWKGRKHIGREELERRKEAETVVPWTDIEPPEYLTGEKLRAEFHEIAAKLQPIGLMTELDADRLAQYVMSRALYNQYTARLSRMARNGDTGELARVQRLQTQAFNQCRACGNDLGLSVTSRARLALQRMKQDEEDYEL